ncbi:hypothetical protein SAMN04487996_13231 [Dyadobacter soli]|uniref:Outer membrane protein beta-barrel domain-containing protein n=1 Tax=Dyadobacter soli TaxID=659014 RepID=A0A1G8AV85_9BACT|nr:DUF3575 domain-containing protein [Dyadobacter soli]SDH24881.1 hypothetical protein SAMN04487996_13231 [Dyadobacter soli]
MKPFYFAMLSLLIALSANAQRSADLSQRSIDVHVDVVPLGFPDPAVRFGSEMMFGNRWSVGMNLGIGVPIKGNTEFVFSEPRWKKGAYRLFEIRPEVKFYWLKRERIGWYIAAEGFASTMKGTAGKSYHYTTGNNSTQVNFDQADFSKTKIGMIGKIGGRMLMGRRMTLDFFSGLGLSKTNPIYSNYQNKTFSKSDPFFEGENYTAGKRIAAHISAGLRIGILLWNKPQ